MLDLVEHVADWSRDAPIFMLCIARPELLDLRPGWGGGKMNATSILLEPLGEAEAITLADSLLDGIELDADTRSRILDDRGGQSAVPGGDGGARARGAWCGQRAADDPRPPAGSARHPERGRANGDRARRGGGQGLPPRRGDGARARRIAPAWAASCCRSCARSSSGRTAPRSPATTPSGSAISSSATPPTTPCRRRFARSCTSGSGRGSRRTASCSSRTSSSGTTWSRRPAISASLIPTTRMRPSSRRRLRTTWPPRVMPRSSAVTRAPRAVCSAAPMPSLRPVRGGGHSCRS